MSKDSKAQVIVDTYLGTCDCMTNKHETWMQRYDLYARVQNQMFLCSQCGWWCGAEELNVVEAELVCNDCVEENKQEEKLAELEALEETELEEIKEG